MHDPQTTEYRKLGITNSFTDKRVAYKNTLFILFTYRYEVLRIRMSPAASPWPFKLREAINETKFLTVTEFSVSSYENCHQRTVSRAELYHRSGTCYVWGSSSTFTSRKHRVRNGLRSFNGCGGYRSLRIFAQKRWALDGKDTRWQHYRQKHWSVK